MFVKFFLRPLFPENSNLKKCKVLIFFDALYILSADDSGRFLQNTREIAQIVGEQNAQSMRVKRSDPQKDWNFTIFQIQGRRSAKCFARISPGLAKHLA